MTRESSTFEFRDVTHSDRNGSLSTSRADTVEHIEQPSDPRFQRPPLGHKGKRQGLLKIHLSWPSLGSKFERSSPGAAIQVKELGQPRNFWYEGTDEQRP